MKKPLQKGIFVISIDLEYAWGYWDKEISDVQKERILDEHNITRRLLSLFEKYKIPATWAIVGKMLEEGNDPLWHDTEDFIEEIQVSSVEHEIGSHSYAHIIYGESDEEEIERDVQKARDIHRKKGLSFDSFVFPRNSERGHALLSQYGIKAFRGRRTTGFKKASHILKRAGHFMSYMYPKASTTPPSKHSSGLINIPASMLLIGRNGLRRLIHPSLVVLKAKNSMRTATQKGEMFHLWFHPSNFSYDTETQFCIFESILQEAHRLRSEGTLEVKTMGQIAQHVNL